MSNNTRVFLTGATGQVGGCVLARLMEQGHHVVCLARSDAKRSAAKRVQDTLHYVGHDNARGFEIVEGDLNSEHFGLDADAYRKLCNSFDMIIHSGARIVFDANAEGEPFRTNVGGTERIIQLAQDAGKAPLCYVSTAYVCGKSGGVVREDILREPPSFKNAYEQSKWQAEQNVWRARDGGLPVQILRPSIVVGDSVLGRALHFQGFYLVGRALSKLTELMGHDRAAATKAIDLVIPGNPMNPVNLVPADYVSDAVCHIATHRENDGSVFHLAHPQPITLGNLSEMFCNYFRIQIGGYNDDAAASTSPITRLFWKVSKPIYDYFGNAPQFDTSNARRVLEPVGIKPAAFDQMLMDKLMDFAEMVEFGRKSFDQLMPQRPTLA